MAYPTCIRKTLTTYSAISDIFEEWWQWQFRYFLGWRNRSTTTILQYEDDSDHEVLMAKETNKYVASYQTKTGIRSQADAQWYKRNSNIHRNFDLYCSAIYYRKSFPEDNNRQYLYLHDDTLWTDESVSTVTCIKWVPLGVESCPNIFCICVEHYGYAEEMGRASLNNKHITKDFCIYRNCTSATNFDPSS